MTTTPKSATLLGRLKRALCRQRPDADTRTIALRRLDPKTAESILANANTRIFLRTDDAASGEAVARQVGAAAADSIVPGRNDKIWRGSDNNPSEGD